MKFLSDTRKYFESLNGEDQKRFLEKYFKTKTFDHMPFMETYVWDRITQEQYGLIWLDFTNTGKALYCHKNDIYAECLRAEQLRHIWEVEYTIGFGDNIKTGYRLRTLSELSKQELSDAIPEIRDFLLKLIKEQYQTLFIINWSSQDNKKNRKPFIEFLEA